jgi:nicotinamide riboside kinase
VIVVVEGPSTAGKTTWIARHREDAPVISEDAGGFPAGVASGQLAVADYWAEVNASRWAMAVEAEHRAQIVLCDTDPFKLHYAWSLWRTGHASGSQWRAAREANRRMFAESRLGVADMILVSIPDPVILAQHKARDSRRTRRNFDLHRQLSEPLREWYHAVSLLDPLRVHWSHPDESIHSLTALGTRSPRTGSEVYEKLLSHLP